MSFLRTILQRLSSVPAIALLILGETAAEPSTVKLNESSIDRLVAVEGILPSGAAFQFYQPRATGQLSLAATMTFDTAGPGVLDENTLFEFTIGGVKISKRLGDDPKFVRGAKAATFQEQVSDPTTGATHSRSVALRWSAKSLKVTIKAKSLDLATAPWTLAGAMPRRDEPPVKSFPIPLAGYIVFGSSASSVFEMTGSAGASLKSKKGLDGSTVVLSSMQIAGSATGSGTIALPPTVELVDESEVISEALPASGGELRIDAGVLAGATILVGDGAFPEGISVRVNQTRLSVRKDGRLQTVDGFKIFAEATTPGEMEFKLPRMLTEKSLMLPFTVAADGSLQACEVTEVDWNSKSIAIRLRVDPPGNDESAPFRTSGRSVGAVDASANPEWRGWLMEGAILLSGVGVGDPNDFVEGGIEGWLKGIGPSGEDPNEIAEEATELEESATVEVSEPLDAVTISSWPSKLNALRTAAAAMEYEEIGQRYQRQTGFSPLSHGFSVAASETRYLTNTSSGMARFAKWAYDKRNRYPLYQSFLSSADVDFGSGTGQDVISSRATAAGASLIPLGNLLGATAAHMVTCSYLFGSSPIVLRVSQVDSSGKINNKSYRYLLAYGMETVGDSEYSWRIQVYDPMSPGATNRLVRFHPEYGMFYEFQDGSMGVNIRPVLLDSERVNRDAESFGRIMSLAVANRMDGISEIEEFSIEQNTIVTEANQAATFYRHDGGELRISKLKVDDNDFEYGPSDPFEESLDFGLRPGKNEIKFSTWGNISGEDQPLNYPETDENPRRIYFMKMPLVVQKVSGDLQIQPVGDLNPLADLKVQVYDSNSLPVPYPVLKWRIVDPVYYKGGKLEASKLQGSQIQEIGPDQLGQGKVSWTLGTLIDIPQKVEVAVVGVHAYSWPDGPPDVNPSPVTVTSTGPAIFTATRGCPDESEKYRKACLGLWTVRNNSGSQGEMELLDNGVGRYIANGTSYWISWWIQKRGCEYRMYEEGFWHPGGYNGEDREPLTLPVTAFTTFSKWDPGQKPSRDYIKN